MSTTVSPQYNLSEADSNVEGGTPRSGGKPPLGSRTVRRSTGNLATILASKGVRNNKRPSPAGKESEDNSAEEKNRTPNTTPGENNKKIERPTKPRPFDPLTLGTSATGGSVKSVRGTPGLTFNQVGKLSNLTREQLMWEVVKRTRNEELQKHGEMREISPEKRISIMGRFKRYSKIDLISELTTLLSNKEKKALNARKRMAVAAKALKEAADDAEKKRKATKKKNPATEETKAWAKELGIRLSITKPGAQSGTALSEAELQQKIRAKEYALSVGLRREKEFAAQRAAGLGAGWAAAAVEAAKASMNRNAQEYKEQMQLALKKAKNAERAKTKQKEANLHKYTGLMTALMTQIQKDLQKSKKEGKNLSDAMVKKNKQIALATKKMEEIMTKSDKRDNFSKKNILDFISKSAKSNNKLTKKDILEFLSKQKTPTVTVKQSIGNVKAEGGKANVQISNSKKLNREARLDQNIKRRDANYRRVVTTDPMVLKRQKRVFAKKRGELLKSIQKIIKSDRKTSPKIKKKVYDSYAKSPRSRISNLLKLPKKDLITMIKRSTSRISK